MRYVAAFLVVILVGCLGQNRNVMTEGREGKAWWATQYSQKQNPWMAFVRDQPNPYDPWANDDIQRYSVSPVFTKSVTLPVKKAPVKKASAPSFGPLIGPF